MEEVNRVLRETDTWSLLRTARKLATAKKYHSAPTPCKEPGECVANILHTNGLASPECIQPLTQVDMLLAKI